MHAHILQHLSVRDGEPVDADARRHVEQCPTCAAEIALLQRAQRKLCALATLDAPVMAWDGIRSRLQERPATVSRMHWSLVAGLVSAAVLVVVVSISAIESRQRLEAAETKIAAQPPVSVPMLSPPIPPTVAQLVAQSRQLDDLLQDLPQRPSIERVTTAATLDSIEQRIQWLDMQISFAPTAELDEARARRLLSERVDLMDSLVKVRYAEAGSMRF